MSENEKKYVREADRYVKDKWYKNFWYHYKIPAIVVVFLAVVAVVLIVQLYQKEEYDLYIVYVTEDPEVYTEKVKSLTNTITQYVPDVNGDGEITVYIDNIYIGDTHDAPEVYKNKERIMTYMRSGTSMFFIGDNVGMDYLYAAEALVSLEDIADSNLAYGGCAWQLNGTTFEENATMYKLNRDTYFGLRVYEGTIAELSKNSAKKFETAKTTLINIINNNIINETGN